MHVTTILIEACGLFFFRSRMSWGTRQIIIAKALTRNVVDKTISTIVKRFIKFFFFNKQNCLISSQHTINQQHRMNNMVKLK